MKIQAVAVDQLNFGDVVRILPNVSGSPLTVASTHLRTKQTTLTLADGRRLYVRRTSTVLREIN